MPLHGLPLAPCRYNAMQGKAMKEGVGKEGYFYADLIGVVAHNQLKNYC